MMRCKQLTFEDGISGVKLSEAGTGIKFTECKHRICHIFDFYKTLHKAASLLVWSHSHSERLNIF